LNLKIVDCFKIKREGEEKIFNPDKLGNKKLLWHGSRFSSFVGILSQGLRIAPPEAPSTGYLFGKGVYFSDNIQKIWSNSCHYLSMNVGIFILASVALGNTRELNNIVRYDAANLPEGTNSTHVLGWRVPDPSGDKVVFENVTVPLGKLININSTEAGLGANEFIVYNTNQIRMEYIVRVTDK
jgi:poly [ADP-ribose] polymerase